jgi:hypothetical protein
MDTGVLSGGKVAGKWVWPLTFIYRLGLYLSVFKLCEV